MLAGITTRWRTGSRPAPPPMIGDPVDPAALERCADQTEAEYQQWLGEGGQRKHRVFFWRRC